MAFNDWGNPPIYSTTGQPVASPSTVTLVAELDSTQLGTKNFAPSQSGVYNVTWILGSDTNCTWQCERAASTALVAAFTNGYEAFFPKTGTALSAQFVTRHVLEKDDRLRVRVQSTFTASVSATIVAERLT